MSAPVLRPEYLALIQRAQQCPILRLIPHPDPERAKQEVLARARGREALREQSVRASLAQLHAMFRQWLGKTYDVDILDAALAARLAHLCCKEDRPPWLLVVGGSGDAKTETIRSLEKSSGAFFVGTITSQATLLSGIGKNDADKDATGGLLKVLPAESFWLLVDVTSILSLSHDARSGVLDGFRFMFDGRWPRATGGGGGRSEHWQGRIPQKPDADVSGSVTPRAYSC